MELKEITLEQCFKFLLDHYGEDKDLIDVYHIEAGTDVVTCATRTMNDLKSGMDLKLYQIDESTVFGTELGNTYLNVIYVRPYFRNKSKMKDIWSKIKTVCSDNFYTGLYKKNTRAINFYLKNDGQIISKTDNGVLIQIGDK